MDSGNITFPKFGDHDPNMTSSDEKGHLSVFRIAATCILTVVILTGNILVLIVTPHMSRLHKAVVYFMAQLAIADILVGFCMPLHLTMVLYRPMLDLIDVCILSYTTMCFTQSASLGCLLVMTIDCYVKVTYPLHYPVWMTRRCCIALTCAVWQIPLAIGFLLPTFWHNDWTDNPTKDCDFVLVFKTEVIFIGMGYCVIISLAMLILYSSIILTVKRQSHQLQHIRQCSSLHPNQNYLALRMAKTCLIIVGLFLLCWLPLQIFTGIQIIGNLYDNETLLKCRTISSFLAIFNSALNPFVYAVRLPDWRQSLKKICGCQKCITSQRVSLEMK